MCINIRPKGPKNVTEVKLGKSQTSETSDKNSRKERICRLKDTLASFSSVNEHLTVNYEWLRTFCHRKCNTMNKSSVNADKSRMAWQVRHHSPVTSRLKA